MSNKIQIELSDLERQGQVLGGLASQMETLTNEFNNNANKMYGSLHGFTKIHLTLESLCAISRSRALTKELQFGSEVAQKCVEAYRAADQQTAKDINMNQTIIDIGGDSYHDQADSTSEQVIVSGTKSYSYKGQEYNIVAGFDENYKIKQRDTKFKLVKNADGTYSSWSCAATSIEMMRRMKGIDDGENWEEKFKKNGWTDGTGTIQTGQKNRDVYAEMGANSVPGADSLTGQARLNCIYNQISQGNPVYTKVREKGNGHNQHYAVVVGVKKGADPNNLKDSDFILADPASGKIKNVTEGKDYSLTRKGNMRTIS